MRRQAIVSQLTWRTPARPWHSWLASRPPIFSLPLAGGAATSAVQTFMGLGAPSPALSVSLAGAGPALFPHCLPVTLPPRVLGWLSWVRGATPRTGATPRARIATPAPCRPAYPAHLYSAPVVMSGGLPPGRPGYPLIVALVDEGGAAPDAPADPALAVAPAPAPAVSRGAPTNLAKEAAAADLLLPVVLAPEPQ